MCFIFHGEILLFFDKEIGKILDFFFPSVHVINFANFWVKIFQNFDMKRMKKENIKPTPHNSLSKI